MIDNKLVKRIVCRDATAKLTHACDGILYYTIEDEQIFVQIPVDMNDKEEVGTTTFSGEYKPITLMRYIRKALENDTLVVEWK